MKKLWATLLALALPAAAHACSVCYAANDRNRSAFFDTTIVLSLLPLGMVAGGVMWFGRRARLMLAEEFADHDAGLDSTDGDSGASGGAGS